MNTIPITLAFVAGLVSFLAPCILPIIPGFLAYLAGSSTQNKATRGEIFLNSVFFVLGFSIVFALIGVLLNSVLQSVAFLLQTWLSRIGGALIILFGLYLAGLVRIPLFERTYQFSVKGKFHSRYVTSFLFGLAFAAGWTPCVGPALGAILGLAASAPGSAFVLLLSYALGLGVPFLLVGLFAAEAARLIDRYASWALVLNRIFGVLLIVVGVLVFTGTLSLIANFDFVNKLLL